MPDKDKKPSKKKVSFRPSIQVNCKQLFVIACILGLFILIPSTISYLLNPDRKPVDETFSLVLKSLKIETYDTDSPLMLTIPLVNKEVNLTVFKQNPQLIIAVGAVLAVFALIIAITLVRNLRRK
ncbi:hypothetical protein JW766_06060 [Candidatus Dojkabacteria bacterium]|nr:hypothetical protein [Candidatus Dojkabacteria bacterium]